MAVLILCAVFCMELSRQFIVLFCSISMVKCKFGCMVLKSVRMPCMFVWLGSKMGRIST
jgi:hypothetical protein